MYKFLSLEWFNAVDNLNAQAGDLHLPPTLANLIINFTVAGIDEILLHLKDGKFTQHHHDNADATISISQETLSDLIHQKDTNAIIEAFMTGKIYIDGDMSKVMALQSSKPSQEQKVLYKKILELTVF